MRSRWLRFDWLPPFNEPKELWVTVGVWKGLADLLSTLDFLVPLLCFFGNFVLLGPCQEKISSNTEVVDTILSVLELEME